MFNLNEMQRRKTVKQKFYTSSNTQLTMFGTNPRVHYISSNVKYDIAIARRLIHSEVNSLWPGDATWRKNQR